MKIITERVLIKEVAKRWKEQYPNSEQDIYQKLKLLNKETATAKDVENIIGNSSWTNIPRCDECGQETEIVIQLGEEPDYESSTIVIICEDCLKQAIKAVEGGKNGH